MWTYINLPVFGVTMTSKSTAEAIQRCKDRLPGCSFGEWSIADNGVRTLNVWIKAADHLRFLLGDPTKIPDAVIIESPGRVLEVNVPQVGV